MSLAHASPREQESAPRRTSLLLRIRSRNEVGPHDGCRVNAGTWNAADHSVRDRSSGESGRQMPVSARDRREVQAGGWRLPRCRSGAAGTEGVMSRYD